MKTKVTLITLAISLLFVAGLLATYQEVIAQQWAVKDSKPNKSFEEYSQMTNLQERLTALKKETPRNRSLLWRQNIIYQASRTKLTRKQKAWVKEWHDLLDENFFTQAVGEESEFIKTDLGKTYENLMIRKVELFDKEQSRKFCSTFGDESTLVNSVQESSIYDSFYCNCTSSWCAQCPQDEDCTNSNCLRASDNCGCGAFWPCTKKCSLGLP